MPGKCAPSPKCPRCRAVPRLYVEYWRDHSIEFSARKDGWPAETITMSEGSPYRVRATCGNAACAHEWTLRGVSQITVLESKREASERLAALGLTP